jgi:hypothetical protein
VPWERVKKHEYHNLIALCPNCHRRAEKGEIDRESLRRYKANLRFAHDKFSQLEIDILFALHGKAPAHEAQWPPFLTLLITRILEAGYVRLMPNPAGSAAILGMEIAPAILTLTQAGIEFVQSLETSDKEEPPAA